jgi:hypothetical protein
MNQITNSIVAPIESSRPVVETLLGLADEACMRGDRDTCVAILQAIYNQFDLAT